MKIIVGSKSKHKIESVTEALRHCNFNCEIDSTKATSDIPEQPSGIEQTRIGASNRARNARALVPNADMWIGIESGIVGAYGSFYDVAFVVLLLPNGRTVSAMSGGHEVPNEYVMEAKARGFQQCTAGLVMSERTGCDATDGTSHVTGGVVSRTDTLTQALTIAFASFLNSKQ